MDGWVSWLFLGIIIAAIIALLVWSFLSNRKRRKNFEETVNAIKPGNKVKTIGGIIGEVVEVNEEEGTFVLRTGDANGNCSFMKFDKQAIYQTDAKPEPAPEAPAAEKASAPAEEEKTRRSLRRGEEGRDRLRREGRRKEINGIFASASA